MIQNGEGANEVNEGGYHVPVLLHESIDALQIKPDGIYADCTFGGGGHSKAILEKLDANGKLFVFDRDADAKQNVPDDERVTFIPQDFRHLQRFMRLYKVAGVDGILADLGVSSHQFNTAERGFSTRFDAQLDMRMDRRESNTAASILNTYSEAQLKLLFERYGEVTNSKTLAALITEARVTKKFDTINAFKTVLQPIVKGNPNKYLAQVFQALRIEVNREMESLEEMLQQSIAVLNPGGRIAIISFHSLEDRVVKNFFRAGKIDVTEDEQDVFGAKREKSFSHHYKEADQRFAERTKRKSTLSQCKTSGSRKNIMAEKQPQDPSPVKAEKKRFLNYNRIVRNIPFMLFLAGLAVVYIYNGHHADKLVRKIATTEKNIKELEYEFKSVKSDLIFRSKAGELVRAVEPLGLREPQVPPMVIGTETNKETAEAGK